MITINRERLLGDLRFLRSMGKKGSGVVRPAFSDIDMAARRWLEERYFEAGLSAQIDPTNTQISIYSIIPKIRIFQKESASRKNGSCIIDYHDIPIILYY